MFEIDNEVPLNIMFELYNIFSVVEQRGQVYREKGLVVEIRSREQGHNQPHVHASYSGYNVSIDIMNCKIIQGNLPKNKMDLALGFVINNQEFLMKMWEKYHNCGFKY